MKCKCCNNNFNLDEIDLDGFCYDCANYDPHYNPDSISMIKELLEITINGLATARHVSSTKIITDFVAQYANNNPEKYIKDIVSNVVAKKQNDAKVN